MLRFVTGILHKLLVAALLVAIIQHEPTMRQIADSLIRIQFGMHWILQDLHGRFTHMVLGLANDGYMVKQWKQLVKTLTPTPHPWATNWLMDLMYARTHYFCALHECLILDVREGRAPYVSWAGRSWFNWSLGGIWDEMVEQCGMGWARLTI